MSDYTFTVCTNNVDDATTNIAPVSEQRFDLEHPSNNIAHVTLADSVDVAYITMGGKTYYLDDTTGEGIADCFDNPHSSGSR